MADVSFAQELELVCHDAGVEYHKFGRICEEISSRVPFDTISAHYISAGPLPVLPEMKLDVFLLTQTFLYDYVVSTAGSEEWFILPLTSISQLKESRALDDRFWSLAITAHFQDDEGLILADEIKNRGKISAFTNRCRDNISAIIDGMSATYPYI